MAARTSCSPGTGYAHHHAYLHPCPHPCLLLLALALALTTSLFCFAAVVDHAHHPNDHGGPAGVPHFFPKRLRRCLHRHIGNGVLLFSSTT